MKYLRRFIFLSTFLLTGLTGCRKFVEIEAPTSPAVGTIVFSNDENAFATMSGLYISLGNDGLTMFDGAMSVFGGLCADELMNLSASGEFDPFRRNEISADDFTNWNKFWSKAYNYIYHANAIIEGVERSATVSEPARIQLSGEAKFLRAFFYFYLVNIYGEVPLLLSTDYVANRVKPRVPIDIVYAQIITDIETAILSLASPRHVDDRLRSNKWSAIALLARVNIYRAEWAKAIELASQLIADPALHLEPDLSRVFVHGNPESIWELAHTNNITYEAALFIPFSSGGLPVLVLSDGLMDAITVNDRRRSEWTGIGNGQTHYYPHKYRQRQSGGSIEHAVLMRLAEVFLIRSEALAQLGKFEESREDLNIIRRRAGLSNLNVNTKEELLLAIEHERRVELMAEWGHRWLDLKRMKRSNAVLAPIKGPGWQPTDTLFPIPIQEIRLNPYLTQNTGY